jgi:hypothetical protein
MSEPAPSFQHFQNDIELTRDLLLDSLYRIRKYASEFQEESDIGEYVQILAKVEQKKHA